MNLTPKLYDEDDKEIVAPPGHVLVQGLNSVAWIPVEDYEAAFVYTPPEEEKNDAR